MAELLQLRLTTVRGGILPLKVSSYDRGVGSAASERSSSKSGEASSANQNSSMSKMSDELLLREGYLFRQEGLALPYLTPQQIRAQQEQQEGLQLQNQYGKMIRVEPEAAARSHLQNMFLPFDDKTTVGE